jgi:hypothetical protein
METRIIEDRSVKLFVGKDFTKFFLPVNGYPRTGRFSLWEARGCVDG